MQKNNETDTTDLLNAKKMLKLTPQICLMQKNVKTDTLDLLKAKNVLNYY